ncbi:PREDICTED: nicotinamide/nicotinic acid mononucleotide adenylyltransferase 1-like isoform X2 [Priapulus caudatus]|uniref:Nicotinamide/nicotinic acid mononucleotide adenylyltransferase 1-like isoform X2 n=1 Tax=Priapulus caudatus TaxID=37621 RepID=A0ABM1E5N7_PRICU|nr:PREDICTED: nicotinamide/nicotinic acid mononucleotide adenylyltransferase 1-like isoform X2 [Priapulus caudatus]
MAPTKVVLLACGSFNPVTNMHLRIFELARDQLQRTGLFTVVGGVVSPVNDAYVKKDLVESYHRVQMAKLATQSSDWIRVDPWESEQNSWAETLKVLNYLQLQLDSGCLMSNESPNKNSPKKRRKRRRISDEIQVDEVDYNITNTVISNQSLINTSEPMKAKLLCGADLLESFAVPGLWQQEHDNIHIITEWMPNEISSTRIRRALGRGESVKYLLQDGVIDYIKKHELYGAVSTVNSNLSK